MARRLEGEKDYDFELIFGMRRRFACEVTGQKLKIRVIDASDAKAVVDKALVTVNQFAKDPSYASMPALLAKAKGVLVYPQILEGGFVIGGSSGAGRPSKCSRSMPWPVSACPSPSVASRCP